MNDEVVVDYVCKNCLTGSQIKNGKCWKCGRKVSSIIIGDKKKGKESVSVDFVLSEKAGAVSWV